MKTNCVINAALSLAAFAVASVTSVFAQPTADDVLVDLGYGAVAEWTNLSYTNSTLAASTASGVTGQSISVWSPGFKASQGFYSWGGDFGTTVGAGLSTAGANTVVLQIAGAVVNGYIEDEDFTFTAADHLFIGSGPALYYTRQDLSTGGPVYPVLAGVLGTAPGTAHGTSIDYVGFTWVWNLTTINGGSPVTSVSIDAPLLNHCSTLGAQLTFGSTYDSGFFDTFEGTEIEPE